MGSAFKLFIAYAALATGLISAGRLRTTTGHVHDAARSTTGRVRQRRPVRVPQLVLPAGNGPVRVRQRQRGHGRWPCRATRSTTSSARTFFLDDRARSCRTRSRQFGFGADTGIDLPFEFDGRIPTNELKAQLVETACSAEDEAPTLLARRPPADWRSARACWPRRRCSSPSATRRSPTAASVLTPQVVQAIYAPRRPTASPASPTCRQATVVAADRPPRRRQIPMPPEVREPIVDGLRRNITGPGRQRPLDHGRGAVRRRLPGRRRSRSPARPAPPRAADSYPWNDSSAFAAFSLDPDRRTRSSSYLEKSGFGSHGRGAGRQVHVPGAVGRSRRSTRSRSPSRSTSTSDGGRPSRCPDVDRPAWPAAPTPAPIRPPATERAMGLSMLQRKPDSGLGNIRSSPADPSRNIDWVLLLGPGRAHRRSAASSCTRRRGRRTRRPLQVRHPPGDLRHRRRAS